jgi:glycerophosphoryl diester phosphodiesterase
MRWLSGRPRPGHPYFAGAPLLIAHRGGSALAPENTMLAFRRAVEWWSADILEIDVHATRDGEVVVIHDDTVDRTTNGFGAVADLSFDEIRELDAGFQFSPDEGRSFPFRGRGEKVPTLREVLVEFPTQRVNVEIKAGSAQRPVWQTVRDLGAEHRVLIAAGQRSNRALFASYPGPTSASGKELYLFLLLVRAGATSQFRIDVDAFQMPERHHGRQVLSPRWVRGAHALNIPVHVWTVNGVADMQRLLDWDVDGIITDRPDRLAQVLHERTGRPLPAGPPTDGADPFLERLLRT